MIRTELGRHVEGWFPLLGALLSLPSLLLMKTPTQGSQTSVFCAVTPGLEDRSGCYFRLAAELAVAEAVSLLWLLLSCMLTRNVFDLSDCAEKEVAPEGRDDVMARKLWEESARLVGLTDTS